MARKPTLLSRVTVWALAVSRRKLLDYSCPKSPHRYTQPQLMAVLVLRAFTRQTYCGGSGVVKTPWRSRMAALFAGGGPAD